MELAYGSKLARKDAPEMLLIANMLEEMGVQGSDLFLRRYTTTLGKTIYTPFDVGVESPGYDFASQIRTCVHEHQHVKQFLDAGPKFSLDYLTDSAHRAAYEVEAMKCNMEIHFWLFGKLPGINGMAWKLTDYACTDADIGVTIKALEMIARTVEQGGVSSDAGKVAVNWLNELTVV
jgi:hypothetical protein